MSVGFDLLLVLYMHHMSNPPTGIHSTDAVYIWCSVQLSAVLFCGREWCGGVCAVVVCLLNTDV